MAEDDATSESKPSWHDREINQALQRLANARAQLATLEAQAATSIARPEPDPADVELATKLQADIAKFTAKAAGRFGASSARTKLDESQRQLRVVLERLGVDQLEDLQDGAASGGSTIDPAVLDFARRECADAEKAFLEVTAMVIPEVEPEPDEPEAEVIAAAPFGDDDVDLRIEPSAAS